MNNQSFLDALKEEVRTHPAVNHPFLAKLAVTPYTREDYRVYALQHYPLVHGFTRYLENLLLNAPDGNTRLWLARVLVDEYGEGSDGEDHPSLYRHFLLATGAREEEVYNTPLSASVTRFIRRHRELTAHGNFLVGLGAVGPGHEWAIPHMFPPLIAGLRRAGFAERDIRYFTLHIQQDEHHGAWLAAALERFCKTDEDRALVREGCLTSLSLRAQFWSGIEERIAGWRQPHAASHLFSDRARRRGSDLLRQTSHLLPRSKRLLRPARMAVASTLQDLFDA